MRVHEIQGLLFGGAHGIMGGLAGAGGPSPLSLKLGWLAKQNGPKTCIPRVLAPNQTKKKEEFQGASDSTAV